jgi:hypothetical protein
MADSESHTIKSVCDAIGSAVRTVEF